MLAPSRIKHRKQQKGKMRGKAYKGSSLAFGAYGLQALAGAWITERQIEAGRIALTRHVKRGGKVWIRIFPHKPVGKKPAETRMGKGKGSPDGWVAPIKPGTLLYEIAGVEESLALEALRLAMHKMPVRCKLVKRSDSL